MKPYKRLIAEIVYWLALCSLILLGIITNAFENRGVFSLFTIIFVIPKALLVWFLYKRANLGLNIVNIILDCILISPIMYEIGLMVYYEPKMMLEPTMLLIQTVVIIMFVCGYFARWRKVVV